MLERLRDRWVQGGALAGLLLLLLLPLLARGRPAWFAAVLLQLPLYMLHQWEEHDDDRFRRFVNATMGHGREVLSPAAVFVINIPGVWGVIALSLWLAVGVRPGLGLIAVDLVLVNALAHLGAGLALRRYNPGLVSAVLLFLPAGVWSYAVLIGAGASLADQAIGLISALAIHAAIIFHVRRKVHRAPMGVTRTS